MDVRDLYNTETEIWLKIGCTRYEVSNLGRFKSNYGCNHGGWRLKKQHISKTGYLSLRININGVGRTCKSHRLIAQVFIPNPNKLPQVNHIDGNKLNNALSNLEWVTNRQNSIHAWDTGLMPLQYGEKASKSKLNKRQVLVIANSGKSDNELAATYKVHSSTINNIRCGKTWRQTTGKNRKYKEVNTETIINIFKTQGKDEELSKLFGYSRQYINSIKRGAIHSGITGAVYKRKNKPAAKVSAELVENIFTSKLMTHLTSKKYNVSKSLVRKIKSGEIYTNITDNLK